MLCPLYEWNMGLLTEEAWGRWLLHQVHIEAVNFSDGKKLQYYTKTRYYIELLLSVMFYFANYYLDVLGHALQRQNLPVFEDIVQYLDYMKLDEPIIGE